MELWVQSEHTCESDFLWQIDARRLEQIHISAFPVCPVSHWRTMWLWSNQEKECRIAQRKQPNTKVETWTWDNLLGELDLQHQRCSWPLGHKFSSASQPTGKNLIEHLIQALQTSAVMSSHCSYSFWKAHLSVWLMILDFSSLCWDQFLTEVQEQSISKSISILLWVTKLHLMMVGPSASAWP